MNENDLKRAVSSIKMNDSQKERVMRNISIRKPKPALRAVGIAAAFILLLSAGAAFAHFTGIWSNLFGTDDTGLQKSLEYYYLQNVHMDYVTSDGLGAKVETVMLDNSTFATVFNFQLPEAVQGFNWLNYDMVIHDENGIILWGEGKGMISTGVSRNVASEDGIIVKVSEICANSNHNYPKSSKLYYEFTNLKIMNDSKVLKEYNGNWSWEIDTDAIFVNRAEYPYEAVSVLSHLKVIYATLTNTGFDIKWEYGGIVSEETYLKAKLIDSDGMEYPCERQVGVDDESGNTIITASFAITRFTAKPSYKLVIGDWSGELRETRTLYSQIKNYISSVLTKEYEPYYTDFSFVVYGYNEDNNGDSFTATLFLEMTTKEIGSSYFQLQVKGKLRQGEEIDEKSLEVLSFRDGDNVYDVPLEDFFPRNNR